MKKLDCSTPEIPKQLRTVLEVDEEEVEGETVRVQYKLVINKITWSTPRTMRARAVLAKFRLAPVKRLGGLLKRFGIGETMEFVEQWTLCQEESSGIIYNGEPYGNNGIRDVLITMALKRGTILTESLMEQMFAKLERQLSQHYAEVMQLRGVDVKSSEVHRLILVL